MRPCRPVCDCCTFCSIREMRQIVARFQLRSVNVRCPFTSFDLRYLLITIIRWMCEITCAKNRMRTWTIPSGKWPPLSLSIAIESHTARRCNARKCIESSANLFRNRWLCSLLISLRRRQFLFTSAAAVAALRIAAKSKQIIIATANRPNASIWPIYIFRIMVNSAKYTQSPAIIAVRRLLHPLSHTFFADFRS